MREGGLRTPTNAREHAIKQLEDFFSGPHGPAALSADVLNKYGGHGFVVGWRTKIQASNGAMHDLHVLADGAFPYQTPRIALAEPPPPLTWPHVEPAGLLCLHQPDEAIPADNPVGVVGWLLDQARQLIDDSQRGTQSRAFQDEFLSYWSFAATGNDLISLLEPCGPSRRIVLWHGNGRAVLAEDRCCLDVWLGHMKHSYNGTRRDAFSNAALLWLPKPLVPAEYPRTGADIRMLAESGQGNARHMLTSILSVDRKMLHILLGMPSHNGVCFAVASVTRPQNRRRSKGNPLVAGYRPSRVPKKILYVRYLSATASVTKRSVRRADHTWIHGRDRDPRQDVLRRKSVAIVGCGSLGGHVARLIAQSGVGNLILIDPDRLEWANISRHILGATAVGESKSKALAEHIQSSFPHLKNVSFHNSALNVTAEQIITAIRGCDLVLDTAANWGVTNLLNELQQTEAAFPTVVYAWMESHAVATHVVVPKVGQSCIQCGFSTDGNPNLAISDWPETARTAQTPACGGVFTPYGASELSWAQSLVLDMVVAALVGEVEPDNHRVWIGSKKHLENAGGQWARRWIEQVADPGRGAVNVWRPWLAREDCPSCRRAVDGP